MFSTWEWHTREGKTQTRTYKGKEFFQWHRREFNFFQWHRRDSLKLLMANSVLSSLATFYMCSIKVPVTILNQLDKYRRHCLWRGGDLNAKRPPLAAWKMVTKSKANVGLGVLNLRLQKEVLLMKNLHKFLNKEDLSWVKLIWCTHYSNGKLPGHEKKEPFGGEVC
jgi:hypothetical protein